MKNLLLTLTLLLSLFAPLAGQTNNTRPTTSAPPPQTVTASAPATETKSDVARLRGESFEMVWRTIKDTHYDPTFGGVDWNKVREQYAPRVAAAKTDSEFYNLLRQMIGELRLSHFVIYPPGVLDRNSAGGSTDAVQATKGQIGVDVRIVDGQAVITRVTPQSVAARSGLRIGFAITKINDTVVKESIERLAKTDLSPAYKQLYAVGEILHRMTGKPGTSLRLTYLDETDREREASLVLEPSNDQMSEPFGNFPAVPTQFESRRLANGIGYLRFNIWVVSQMEKIRAGVRTMTDAPGLIIDLRGNPGGLGIMSMGLAGMLDSNQITLGTMTQRTGHINFIANPQPNAYKGAVVILIDGMSGSTSEIFAIGMQEAGRAEVVGEKSLGAALPSVFSKLPTGAVFQFAFADFKTPKGVTIEGRGVVPDHEARLDRRSLLDDRDSQLDVAVERIMARIKAKEKPKS